jgi:TRAP-type C4-dicarboxylate transport system substrate-binding protein
MSARRARALAVAAALALLACGAREAPPRAADGALELRLVSQFPRQSILAAPARFVEEELARRFGERLSIRAFYGGALVTPEEQLAAIGRGVADAGTGFWIYAPGRLPLGSFEYRFVLNDPDVRHQAAVKRRMFETIPALDAELAAANVAPPLVFAPLSPYLLLSREPIRGLEEVRGKRVGFTPVEYVPLFRSLGAVPVLSPASEFYERLGLGVVDAVLVSVEILHLFRLHELAPHLLDLALNTPTPGSVWVNLDYWNALAPADRTRFVEAGRAAEARYLDLLEDEVRRARAALLAAGVSVSRPSEASIRAWAGRLPPFAREWAASMDARGLPGSAVVDAYVALSGATP